MRMSRPRSLRSTGQIASTGGALFILSGPRQGPNEPAAPSQLWAVLDPAFAAVRVAVAGVVAVVAAPVVVVVVRGSVRVTR